MILCWHADELCDPLSFVAHTEKAATLARKIAVKLKEVIDRQQFEIIIQAKIGLKVVTCDVLRYYLTLI